MFGRKKDEIAEVTESVKGIIGEITDDIRSKIVGGTLAEVKKTMNDVLSSEGSIITLRKEKASLERQIEKLKSTAKIEETEIKALLKIAEDKSVIDLKMKELELQGKYQEKEAKMTNAYHKDLSDGIAAERDRLDVFMGKVIDKLTHIKHIDGVCETEVKVVK
jgi:cell division protein FtsB